MATPKHPHPTLPPVYSAAEIASALRCSEWWVKEQARKGRIPFTKPGGTYRFTAEHFAEIVRIFEFQASGGSLNTPRASTPAPRRQTPAAPAPTVRLKARTPRRARRDQSQSAAA
jgi:excisionase family DNA binding protein